MNLSIHLDTKINHAVVQEIENGDTVPAIEAKSLNVYYADFLAVREVDIAIQKQKITALIGPSGCGKSTVLRAFNRMNDLIPVARTEGEVLFHGQNRFRQ